MSIEENKLQEEAVESTVKPEENKKQLSKGALIGIIGGAVALVAVIIVVIILAIGGNKTPECTAHVDADDNLKCDNCGDDFEDGFEIRTTTVTFTVKVVDGEVIPATQFTLTRDEKSVTLTVGEDGRVSGTLEVGVYSLEYDYDTVPSGFFQNDFEVEIKADTTYVELSFVDNNPDGTEGNPFFVSEDETEIVIDPDQEIFYSYRGAVAKHLTIRSNDLSVTYNGETYDPVDGVISFFIVPEIGVSSFFSVRNNSENTVSGIIELIAPLGSMDNPILLENTSESCTVPAEGVVYYNWTATKSGVLIVHLSDNNDNSIGISRVLANDVPISSQTADDNYAYMTVTKDDVISVSVSTNKKTETVVSFSLEIYAGTESEPVPVLIDYIDISYMQGERITFSAEVGKTVTIRDEDSITVYYNGEGLVPQKGKISFDLVERSLFTVENNQDGINSVTISFE